jgi:hypothetical protein
MLRRYLIPLGAFILGGSLIAATYFGILIWAQGWGDARSIFLPNRWYVIPIWITFGIQTMLFSILRFRLFVPVAVTTQSGAGIPLSGVIGTSGGTSVTAMVACCLHHATDVLPVLGLSAATTFLTRYQRSFMLLGLAMNLAGIVFMLTVLYRAYQKVKPIQNLQPNLETQ